MKRKKAKQLKKDLAEAMRQLRQTEIYLREARIFTNSLKDLLAEIMNAKEKSLMPWIGFESYKFSERIKEALKPPATFREQFIKFMELTLKTIFSSVSEIVPEAVQDEKLQGSAGHPGEATGSTTPHCVPQPKHEQEDSLPPVVAAPERERIIPSEAEISALIEIKRNAAQVIVNADTHDSEGSCLRLCPECDYALVHLRAALEKYGELK